MCCYLVSYLGGAGRFHTTTWVSVEGRFYPGFLLHLRIRPSTIDITYDQVVSQRPYGRWIDCLPNRTWRPRQGGPNGQKPALYPVSGLIPVRTCHGPKCPPAQPPSGASGPLAAAILKRGLERPRRRAGSPTWGRARAGGRPLGCVARGRLRWGRREGCWGGRQTGINLCILLAPATSGKALANALCPALCPLCGGPAASLAPRRPPKRCPDLPRSRLLKLGAARTARCGVLRRRRVLS